MMHNNIRKFDSGDHSFEAVPPKRHSSYEDRAKSDSVSKRGDARLFVTQRNCNSTHKQSYDKTSSVFYQQNNEYSIVPVIIHLDFKLNKKLFDKIYFVKVNAELNNGYYSQKL